MSLEAQVISAVCKNKDIGVIFTEGIEDMFTSYKDVWTGLKSYYYKFNAVPDIEVLQGRFRDFEPVEVKGETAYYVTELKNHYLKTEIANLLLEQGGRLKNESPERVLQLLTTGIGNLSRYTASTRDLNLTDFDAAEKHYKSVSERTQATGAPGIPTGFASIDKFYHTGMAPGHLIVLIGWPGKGKTWFAAYLACRAWLQGYRPMIVSLEMSPENMRDRIYTMLGSGLFKASDFARGEVDLENFREWAAANLDKRNDFIIVSNEGISDVTPAHVQGKIDQYHPDIVVCDYHQLFNDNKQSRSEVERNKNISREFKQLAMTNQIPVIDITAATMDDISDTDSPPLLSQVAWSKQIEYDADMAMAVHRVPDTNIIEIISRKNRHGSDFGMFLDWDIDRGIIKETA